MPKLLYLDTARLGRMTPRARRASIDFSRFASEHGGSLYLGDFLRHGFRAWPHGFQGEYRGLEDWDGVARLKEKLIELAGAKQESEVLLSARSATLMKSASRLLAGPCRNVLTTDLTWPVYDRIFRREQRTSACRITTVPLRRAIFRQRLTEAELVELLARTFQQETCDGLFLPLVDCLGIHLPLPAIVERIRSENELRFVVVDGAQAIQHVSLGLAGDYCDFLLAGTHKWLGAYQPMGLGFFGHPRSSGHVHDSLLRWTNRGEIDDALLSFGGELQSGQSHPFGETVAVSPMLVGNAAVVDALDASVHGKGDGIQRNRGLIVETATRHGWKHVSPAPTFASRISVFQSSRKRDREETPDCLRRRFLVNDIVVSAYDKGIIRISIPTPPISAEEAKSLDTAFSTRRSGPIVDSLFTD